MQQPDREEADLGETSPPGGEDWLDGVIAGFMSEDLTEAVEAALNEASDSGRDESPRAWLADGRSRIDDTMASLLAPIIRKAMDERPDGVAARLERIESRLEAIERRLGDR